MSATRREVIRGIGQAAIGASVAIAVGDPAQAQQNPAFRIEDTFAAFMRDLGGSSDDGGGQVTFTGRDPFVQSRFRTGACRSATCWGFACSVGRRRTSRGGGGRTRRCRAASPCRVRHRRNTDASQRCSLGWRRASPPGEKELDRFTTGIV